MAAVLAFGPGVVRGDSDGDSRELISMLSGVLSKPMRDSGEDF